MTLNGWIEPTRGNLLSVRTAMNLPILGFADMFASIKTISKRELVRNPSKASHLKPGQSSQLEDSKEPLVVSRRKRARLTAEQIHVELDRLCEGAPEHDAQAALSYLRAIKTS
ncbi:MAG TPA: hypothetical protein VK731_13460 [Candidatus Cybelea sp.]|jgi:hypothetical protein|nr:hypothetical protein [Candidatus Cybelea sp.]